MGNGHSMELAIVCTKRSFIFGNLYIFVDNFSSRSEIGCVLVFPLWHHEVITCVYSFVFPL
jgi:hypothetical protein